MVVPIVEAMTALRRFVLCSDADSVPYVAVVAIGVPPGRFLFPRGRALSGPFAAARITEREGGSKPSESDARERAVTRCATTFPRQRDFPSNHWAPGNRQARDMTAAEKALVVLLVSVSGPRRKNRRWLRGG